VDFCFRYSVVFDEDDDYAMPELVDRCNHHYDSSSTTAAAM
jgi:hypothetical protein